MGKTEMMDREHHIQAALIQWARVTSATVPELRLLYAIPNGGARHPATARRMKAEGVLDGMPDLCLPVPSLGYHALYIEMKTETGRVQPSQVARHQQLREYGNRVDVCRSWTEAAQAIQTYLQKEMPF